MTEYQTYTECALCHTVFLDIRRLVAHLQAEHEYTEELALWNAVLWNLVAGSRYKIPTPNKPSRLALLWYGTLIIFVSASIAALLWAFWH